ncbi:ornithine cyclodeaminase family protein [Sinorhizobium meliloti]|uniref:ornithine cyclodeaminase family protein n=1 Tax=Rhizobium meliloti TaxID=382 RepID=UPI0001E4AC5E|nr:ornithine cyclodeaminase family protein [Sinorhizobium meliloti]AEG57898.1 ornithine cyclodeaminase/mu-crystallin [Sinorhizobium meliloti AK83]MDE4587351.1 ornithine cyclodeaminase family protein [Sinorhizobium meliloti]RVG99895.1 ornithine cyclodeaminase family protein [Sinorhizobium meliloti]SEJ74371.1 ornithine cyclodeaminase [Sinorhizobium meliloti]
MTKEILYLNASDIDRVNISPSDIRTVLREAFRAYRKSSLRIPSKQTVRASSDRYFQTMAAVSADPPFAAVKWVSVIGENTQRGLPNVNGLLILGDFETGLPLAVIDANRLTVIRTAAMSALASEYLATPKGNSLGFVGCGAQAYGHLAALKDVLPTVTNVTCFDRRAESAEKFAAHVNDQGLLGRATDNVDDVLTADVVVSTVPSVEGMQPFLDARKLKPGCLAIAIDMGRSWLPESLSAFDGFIVDDLEQAQDPDNRSKLAYGGPFDADLSSLASGIGDGRRSASDRVLFIYPGFALADLAVASEFYAKAVEMNVGTKMLR